jgi:NIMA (never in mitosis gene a)-related kinase
MEYCEGGDMSGVIKKCKRDRDFLPEEIIWKIFMQIALALHECHKRKDGKILHRDLKPANIFLDSSMNVKLGDFGLSRMMGQESEFAKTHVGTPYYMSPEQITESRYNEKSDIWSLGCLLYEFASLSPPFEALNIGALAVKVRSGKVEKLPTRYSEELQRVVNWMLSLDPNLRPSVEDLLNLPQISLRIREKKLRENQLALKKKEEELKKKEAEINAIEEENRLKKLELDERENKLRELELRY